MKKYSISDTQSILWFLQAVTRFTDSVTIAFIIVLIFCPKIEEKIYEAQLNIVSRKFDIYMYVFSNYINIHVHAICMNEPLQMLRAWITL